MGSNSDWFSCV